MSNRPTKHGLVYLRRSSGRQETSLETQLEWAIAEARRRDVPLDASQDDLKEMKARQLISHKGIRLDDSITGADLNRPGFTALNQDTLGDKSYSHIFIHKRDRYGRPEDAVDMVARERKLLLKGITIVFSDDVSEPMERGRQYLERDIAMMLGYYESGAFLTKLAERVLEKQRWLAREGFRTGGNAPYGFVRVLVDVHGNVLAELSPGRRVRQQGCHVRVIPKQGPQLTTRLFILELKQRGWGLKRIAVHLNTLGIPSPDAGKTRTDHGVAHLVSGKWSPGTVREICIDPVNVGLQEYGRRSEGAHRRLGQDGPRLLNEADRNTKDVPRTVMNDESKVIATQTNNEPLLDMDKFEQMRRQIDERAKNQRGIPRAKDPARYPLSCRLVDLTGGCGAVMYGRKHGQRPIYVCGRYMRSQGTECENNAVDAEAMFRFTIKTLRQLLDRHGNRDQLRQLLLERAQQDNGGTVTNSVDREIQLMTAKVNELKEQESTVRRRMALEKDDERYLAIAAEFDRIHGELQSAEKDLEAKKRLRPLLPPRTQEAEVNAAMEVIDDICRITADERARSEFNPLLRKLGVLIGLNFGSAIKGEKRIVRRLLTGVMRFGGRQLPIPLFGLDNRQGPDGLRDDQGIADPCTNSTCPETLKHVIKRDVDCGEKKTAGTGAQAPIPAALDHERFAQSDSCQPEGISSTKDSRGDWIRTSDLLNPIQAR